MKKINTIISACSFFIVISLLYIIPHLVTESNINHISVAPVSLQFVGEEAFSNTSIQSIVFQNKLKKIGSYAFFNANSLKEVFLPSSVKFIDDSTFLHNKELTIHGVKGSYAQKWAKENDFDFVVDDIWTDTQVSEKTRIEILLILFWIICPTDEKAFLRFCERIIHFIMSMRPQDRPELYPIDYRFP